MERLYTHKEIIKALTNTTLLTETMAETYLNKARHDAELGMTRKFNEVMQITKEYYNVNDNS